MKHILRVVSIALPLVCVTDFAMAFAPGVPPLSGPGSVFHGTERDAPIATKKTQVKKHHSRVHKSSPQ